MSNNEINFGDLLPPKKDGVGKFATSDTVVPEFIKRAAYSPDEVMEETIQKDWERLVQGLSDYVLAEQLTEYELRGMGKPVAENYAEYFHDTLKDVKKNRKKSEQKLFKMIPRHSQLESCEFFERVEEQCEKETEAKERALELYPPTGVAKMDKKDDARKGLMKEANPVWMAPEAQPGAQTNQEAGTCEECKQEVTPRQGYSSNGKLYCMKCHDAGHSVPDKAVAPPLPMAMRKEAKTCEEQAPIVIELTDIEVKDEGEISVKPNHTETVKDMPDTADEKKEVVDVHLMKEAAGAKWKPGQYLYAKYNKAAAHVVYVNEEAKTYTIKVDGTMYPSYYAWQDAHDTFDGVDQEETKDSAWAKSKGLS